MMPLQWENGGLKTKKPGVDHRVSKQKDLARPAAEEQVKSKEMSVKAWLYSPPRLINSKIINHGFRFWFGSGLIF